MLSNRLAGDLNHLVEAASYARKRKPGKTELGKIQTEVLVPCG